MTVRHYYDNINPQPNQRGPLRRLCDGNVYGQKCMFRPYVTRDGLDYCRIHDPDPEVAARRAEMYRRRRGKVIHSN